MSRLEDRLRRETFYTKEETEEEQEIGEDIYPYDNLSKIYDKRQKQAQKEYEKEIKAIEATNPHNLYKDVVTNPSPKGTYQMRIMGRPIDLSALESYLIFKISPRTVTTLMRYNDSKTIQEVGGYSRRKPISLGKNFFMIIIIIIIIMVVGMFFLFGGGNLAQIFRGLFGI